MTNRFRKYISISVILSLLFCAHIAQGMNVPATLVFRHSILKSDLAAVGRVVATEPYETTTRERFSSVVVDTVIFGNADSGDTLRVKWSSNTLEHGDGTISQIVCGGGSQLERFVGVEQFWLLSGENQYRMQLRPLDFATYHVGLEKNFAIYAAGNTPPGSSPAGRHSDMDDLESFPENLAKCEATIHYLESLLSNK